MSYKYGFMVKGWARDIAYALLSLKWSANWAQIRDEFIANPSLYPQASDTLAREGVSTGSDSSWTGMAATFSKHSTTSGNSKKDRQMIFRHKDGNPKERGNWELMYYDMEWDDHFHLPDEIEYESIGRILVNPKFSRSLFGFDFGDQEGEVYAITNPAWPDWVKVGKSVSVGTRVSNYQTSSPLRDYKVEYTRKFTECGAAEKKAHRKLRKSPLVSDDNGEWFKASVSTVISIIDSL